MSIKSRHLAFDRYLTFQELSELLADMAAAYPHLTTLHSIGKSHQGREIWLLELSNPATGPAQDKPGYYIDANIHAEEISGTSVVVYTAWTLLSQHGIDPLVTQLLDEQVFYLVPRVNPDGAEIVQTLPFYEWIGNGRYLPGQEQVGPGLHYADVNDDGLILDMRIPDPSGEWKVSEQDDRLMLPRGPDDLEGRFYRIVPEGIISGWNGGDFAVPRPQDGNLNRNFPSNWVPESQQYGAGEHPLSEPEVAAVVRWILDHPNIAGMQFYHTHSGVILRPWLTYPDTQFLGDDKHLYELLGQMGVEETGYPLISVYEDFTPDKSQKRFGSAIDWSFGALGIPSFSTELWDVFKAAGVVREDYYPLRHFGEEDQLKLLAWQDKALDGEGFVPWTPFEHPQLGAVEIGGWKRLLTFRNPPPARYLAAMAQENCRFTLRHAAAAPRLRLRNGSIRSDHGVHDIDVIVENIGFLPTNLTDQAIAMEAATPVQAQLTGPDSVRFLRGEPIQTVGHLGGRFGRHRAYSRFYDWPMSSKRVRWTVELPTGTVAQLELNVGCPRAGTVRTSIIIQVDGSGGFLPAAG